jgi:hypothetical protein
MSDSALLMSRRGLLALAPLAAAPMLEGEPLPAPELSGKIRREEGPAPVSGATWYVAEAENAALVYRFPAGTLAKARYVSADMLADGNTIQVFSLTLHEGNKGRVFRLGFAALPQCSLRMRMALSLVDQSRWLVDREGAFLKPTCGGDRVDLELVDELRITVRRKAPDRPARFCLTPVAWSVDEPPRLSKPVLPKGPLVDEFGQSRIHDWPGRTRTTEELTRRIQGQLAAAPKHAWPAAFSRWGGWRQRKLAKASGFFTVRKEGDRWWLVDPDGFAFWSAGVDCVRVDTDARVDGIEPALTTMPDAGAQRPRGRGRYVNFLAANLIRALGAEGWRDKWAAIALGELRRLRFNTVGNWSEWEYAAKAGFPYVRPMSFTAPKCGMVYRDFPDVWHPAFPEDAAAYASQLESTRSDPAFIGYFLMNEPTWAFSSELPAAGMLYNTETCYTRNELASFLAVKYGGDAGLAAAWKMPATLSAVRQGRWKGRFTKEATEDLREFSVRMVERYFGTLSQACKKADPNHLNLGMRWAGVPPEWAVRGMKHFDVFSLNCYMDKLPFDRAQRIHEMLQMPVMVGEWHFGALDVGLPATGIGHLRNQAERAKAYRVYLEDAAANPYCVGVHWFTLYDQSALGRFDGECYNIGFLDVCNRPYPEMSEAAIVSHERMYEVAAGKIKPYEAKLEYLPKLF